MRASRPVALLAIATLSGTLLLGGGVSASAASTPAGGPVNFYAPQNGDGIHGSVIITGAIGDYGKTVSIDKNGKTDAKGNYVKVTLQKGTFEINTTTFNAKSRNVKPTFFKATCSALITFTGQVTLFGGTGLYGGISGTLNITGTSGFILPRLASGKNKGQCNLSNNAQPISQYTLIEGSGTVSF
jgi:hypothetical protein